jgi:peroxiredoxin Q/BCP
MSRYSLLSTAIALGLTAAVAGAQGGMAPAPAGPEVGTVAPDFTAPWADASGPKAKDLHLADLKGKVVVLAFYPGDRTSGCTIEMTKFRDDYTKIFTDKAGKDVIVLPTSVDGIDSHVSWAKDAKFPFSMISDAPQAVAALYGSKMAGRTMDSRTVWVIGKDGKIAYRNMRFNVQNQQSFDDLAAAVAAALK